MLLLKRSARVVELPVVFPRSKAAGKIRWRDGLHAVDAAGATSFPAPEGVYDFPAGSAPHPDELK